LFVEPDFWATKKKYSTPDKRDKQPSNPISMKKISKKINIFTLKFLMSSNPYLPS
jgi:hypothetical protein